MDLRDIMMEPTGVQRPDHPDFWILSETILALKADTEEFDSGRITQEEGERRWKAHYEKIGDFDSIAYCATQAALQINGIENGQQWAMMMMMPGAHTKFVATVQAYFDGFVMGAALERKKREQDKTVIDYRAGKWRRNDRKNDGTEIDRVDVIVLLSKGEASLTDRAAVRLAESDDMILRAARDLWEIDDEGAHYDDEDRERLRAQLDAREGE